MHAAVATTAGATHNRKFGKHRRIEASAQSVTKRKSSCYHYGKKVTNDSSNSQKVDFRMASKSQCRQSTRTSTAGIGCQFLLSSAALDCQARLIRDLCTISSLIPSRRSPDKLTLWPCPAFRWFAFSFRRACESFRQVMPRRKVCETFH